LYRIPSIVRVVKLGRLWWDGHVTQMGDAVNLYRILVGKSLENLPLGRPRGWEDNIKIDHREICCEYGW
jgi:hypothetical protein